MPHDQTMRRDLTVSVMTLRAASINEADRSVETVMATENPVTVLDPKTWEVIDEVLRMDGTELPEEVRLLNDHRREGVESVFGSARAIRIEAGEVVGRLFFAADDPEVDRAWSKVRDRHIRDVSIGYQSLDYVDIPAGQTQEVAGRRYTAGNRTLRISTRWQLREVSLLAIGADPAAKIRRETGDPPTTPRETVLMNERLRKYLEAIGLRHEASEEEARQFLALLSGTRAQVAKVLESETDSETSRLMVRAGLEALGVDPEDPSKPAQRSAPPPADPPADPPNPAPPADEARIRAEAQAEERTRAARMRELGGDDVPAELITRAVDEGWDETRASREFLAGVRATRSGSAGRAPAQHSRSHDADVNARSLAAGMLAAYGQDPTKHRFCREYTGQRRGDMLTEQDADRGDRLRDLSAVDLCRECALIDTGRRYHSRGEAIRAAVSGGTLSHVFGTNVYARLVEGWETIGDTTIGWCDEEDVPNFLQQEDISIDESATLDRLPSGGTANHATVSDSHETYKIARYAKKFVMDEQDILNDRLGALLGMPVAMGKAARRLRPDLVYSIMLENPDLVADSGAVFNATAVTTAGGHANLGTGALASATLKAGISAMVKQRLGRTTTDPGEALNLRPKWLIVPAALDWTARELTAAGALAKLFADSSDPWYAQLNLLAQEGLRTVIDDRIGAIGVKDPRTKTVRTGLDTNWFLTAGGTKGLRVAYRMGTGRSPQMRSFILTQGQWGLGWDINHDIGAAFLDFRPWYKSTGAGQ